MEKRMMLLAIFVLMITGLFAETWIYEKKVVIIPIGEKENEIRLNYDNKELQSGPTSFAIDEDENIYIRTSRANILKKFDKNGNYICSSEFEKGLGDYIRFIGYHNNIIYTRSGGNPEKTIVRRYDKDLNIIDYHKIQKTHEHQIVGLSFISNYKGDYGFLRHYHPKKITFQKLKLQGKYWHLRYTKLMDFDYPKVNLQKYCDANAFHFRNFDSEQNLYFEALTGYNKLDKIIIVNQSGKVIKTNILIDIYSYHKIAFRYGTKPFVSRSGNVYNIIPLKDGFRFIKWYKIREEK